MVASIIRFKSPLNFLLNQTLIVIVVRKYLNCATFVLGQMEEEIHEKLREKKALEVTGWCQV
jgi:hypothetical protein